MMKFKVVPSLWHDSSLLLKRFWGLCFGFFCVCVFLVFVWGFFLFVCLVAFSFFEFVDCLFFSIGFNIKSSAIFIWACFYLGCSVQELDVPFVCMQSPQ